MKRGIKGWNDPRPVSVGTWKPTIHLVKMVEDILESGRISYGKYSQEFERQFAEEHQCKYAILSNSGTSALHVALQAEKETFMWRDGYEVIVPATTFISTANIVQHVRLKPVFVDVDPETYNIDPECMQRAINSKTVAVIPVHMFGQPANMTTIVAQTESSNLGVIEDSCESMFVTHRGISVGAWGDVGCFSLYVAHIIVGGVGGVSTTNDAELAGKMRSLVNHGLVLKYLNPDDNFSPQPMAGRRFLFDSVGHSFRVTEFEAALALDQLLRKDEILRIRRRNADHLSAGLFRINEDYGDPFHIQVTMHENQHAHMMYPIVFNKSNGYSVDKLPLMAYLNERGIETRDIPSLLGQPAYPDIDPDDFPVSRWLMKSGFYVGCHQDLSPDDIQFILDQIRLWLDARVTK